MGEKYIWQGDLWDSYLDPVTKRNVKAYDYQVWLPMHFAAGPDTLSGSFTQPLAAARPLPAKCR